MNLTEKYPRLKKWLNYKLWGIILAIGVLLQLLGFIKYSYHSFFFLSGILFWSVIWWIFAILFRKKSEKKQLIVHSIFFFLVVCECFLQIVGIVKTYSEKRWGYYESPYHISSSNNNYWTNRAQMHYNLETNEYNYSVETNSLGYRDKEWKWNEMDDKIRILALGDSFTEGDGAHADSTWLKFLERNINDTNFYFMNGGICGSDPLFESYKLNHTFREFAPNIIILCINQSDIFDIMYRGGFNRFTPNGVKFSNGKWWEPIYASNQVLRLFFRLRYNEYLVQKNQQKNLELEAKQTIEITIDSILTTTKKLHADLVIVFHPFKNEIINQDSSFKDIINTLIRKDLTVINLYTFFNQIKIKNNLESYYWKHDDHHNAKGYELMAEGIYEGLNDYGIIPNQNDSIKNASY
jgi:lysophospholipase L1-like esterase